MQLSDAEKKVLDHFRLYLMTPGNMLCLSSQQIDSMRTGLKNLVERKLLVAEATKGGYCLTRQGFEVMRGAANAAK